MERDRRLIRQGHHTRRPVVREEYDGGISISSMEIVYILISIVTLVLAFTYFFGISDRGLIIGVVAGIIIHELSHKFTAQSMGFRSEYKLWEIGLVLVVAFAIATKGKFIFAAPGFVVTRGMASIKERGIISFSAPFSNIILAVFFAMLSAPWAKSAALVNVFLGAFNLLPLGPLDGSKVLSWNGTVWVLSLLFCLVLGFSLIVPNF